MSCEQCINIYTFPFIISIKLNGCADRYLTDMAEAKRNDPILQKGGLGVEVIGSGSILFACCLFQCVMRISGPGLFVVIQYVFVAMEMEHREKR